MALHESPFQAIRESALKRIRLSEAPAAAIRQQAINAAGLRTSGAGQIPLIEAARARALAEAGVEESIAGQEAGQLGAERLASLQNQFALQQLRLGGELQSGMEATRARRGFQGGLVGLGLGLGAGFLKNALLSKYPGLRPQPTQFSMAS